MSGAFDPALREPVGIIGSGDEPRDSEGYLTAYEVARRLAGANVAVLCGGRTGIMEAACKGAAEGGGVSIALLPSLEIKANEFATFVLKTDLGRLDDPIAEGPPLISRNRVIAGASRCLVAVCGGSGTANEIAHALNFEKTVFGLCGAPDPGPEPPVTDALRANYYRDLSVGDVMARVFEICGVAE
jgi:uncharacterized protein (TIGR00725 family)